MSGDDDRNVTVRACSIVSDWMTQSFVVLHPEARADLERRISAELWGLAPVRVADLEPRPLSPALRRERARLVLAEVFRILAQAPERPLGDSGVKRAIDAVEAVLAHEVRRYHRGEP